MPPRKRPRNDPSSSLVNTPSLPSTQLSRLQLSSQPPAQKKARGSAKAVADTPTVGKQGTPLPEDGWWEISGQEWDNDAKPEGKSSYELLMDWFNDSDNHDYWKGKGGGGAKKGSLACRQWLYEQHCPTRRSAASIERKYNLIHGKWKNTDEFRNRTGTGKGVTLIEEASDGSRERVIEEVNAEAEKLCPDFNEWSQIFKGRTAGDPLQQINGDDDNDPSTDILGRLIDSIPQTSTPRSPPIPFPSPTQRSPDPPVSYTQAGGLGSSFGDSYTLIPAEDQQNSHNDTNIPNPSQIQSDNPNELVSQSLRDRATAQEAEDEFHAQEGVFLDQQVEFARSTANSQQEQNEIRRRAAESMEKYQERKLKIAEKDVELRRKDHIMNSALKMMGERRMDWKEALQEAKRDYDEL